MGGPHRICWPDGRSLLEQPALALAVFDMITDQKMKASKSGGTS